MIQVLIWHKGAIVTSLHQRTRDFLRNEVGVQLWGDLFKLEVEIIDVVQQAA